MVHARRPAVLIAAAALVSLTAALSSADSALASPATAYPQAVLADHPAGYWPLEDNSRYRITDVAGNNPGTPTSSVQDQLPGAFGDHALGFDGQTSSVDFSGPAGSKSYTALQPATELTVEAWVDTNAATGETRTVFESDQGEEGYSLVVQGDGTPAFYLNATGSGTVLEPQNGSYGAASLRVNDQRWHYLVGTYDGSYGRLFVDGQLVDQEPLSGALAYSATGPVLGAAQTDYGVGRFLGLIDDVAVYSHPLTGTQLRAHYRAAGYQPGTPGSGGVTPVAGGSGGSGGSGGGGGGSGGGGEAPKCNELAELDPPFTGLESKPLAIRALSSQSLDVGVEVSASIGAVNVCRENLASMLPALDYFPPAFSITAKPVEGHPERSTFEFETFGWNLPPDAPRDQQRHLAIDWSRVTELSLGPVLGLGYKKGEGAQVSLDLLQLKTNPLTTTLLREGRAFLTAELAPTIGFGLKLDRRALAEAEDTGIAEGQDATTSAAESSSELDTEVHSEIQQTATQVDAAAADDPAFQTAAAAESQSVAEGGAAAATADAGATAGLVDSTIASTGDAATGELAGESGFAEGLDLLVDLLGFAAAADAHHHAAHDPLLVPTRGGLTGTRLLTVRSARPLRRRALHEAPFPRAQIPADARETLRVRGTASVGPLVVSSRTLRPGAWMTIVSPGLSATGPHAALAILQGPRYRATRLVAVKAGTAAISVKLPRRLAAGTWTLAVQDVSGVRFTFAGFSGRTLARIGVFHVRRSHRHGHR